MSEYQKTSKELSGVALGSAETEELPADFQLHGAFKPLLELKSVQEKNNANTYLFRSAPMVATFVRSAGSQTKSVWTFLKKARLVELYPSLRKIMFYYSGRVPIYVHRCFYRSLKLRFPLDVGELSRKAE